MPMTKDTRAFVPTAIRAPSIFRSQVLTTLTRVCICSPCYLHPSPTPASMLADAPLPRGSDATLASGVHCPRVPEQFVTWPLRLVGYVRWDERSAPFSKPDIHFRSLRSQRSRFHRWDRTGSLRL